MSKSKYESAVSTLSCVVTRGCRSVIADIFVLLLTHVDELSTASVPSSWSLKKVFSLDMEEIQHQLLLT